MSEVGKLNPLKSGPLTEQRSNKVTEDKLREVAEMYEKHFIREMMKQMKSTVQEGGFIKKNNAEKIFTDQLDDQYADQWTKSGGIGMSQLIYDQLMEKYGVRFGLKAAVDKPMGPIATNQRMNFSGVSQAPDEETRPNNLKSNSSITFKFENPANEKLPLTNPWEGILLDKKYLEMDQVQYQIKHDNGLESLILTRGTGLGPEHKLSLGDTIKSGEQLGWVSGSSPLFWTVKPNVSE
jgi:peptidoglycan hydrolase FlgJ